MNHTKFGDISSAWTSRISYFFFLIFSVGSIFSISSINGFMSGHLGWAGPDLLSSSRNLNHTGYFLARLVSPDGVVAAYNHHPPLSFWIFNLVSNLSSSYTTALVDSYLFAVLIGILGWALLFACLKKRGIDSLSSSFAVIAVASTPLFVDYRAITTFDVFNVLSSSILFFIFSSLLAQNDKLSKKSMLGISIALCFTISLSWYSVPIIGLCLGYLILRTWHNGRLRNQMLILSLVSFCFFAALWLWIVLSVWLQVKDFETIKTFWLKNTSIEVHPLRNFTPQETIRLLYAHFRKTIPQIPLGLLIGFLIIQMCIRQISKNVLFSKLKILPSGNLASLKAAGLIAAGTAIFILVTRHWSVIHPFAFLMLAAPIAYVVAYIVQVSLRNQLLKVACLVFISWASLMTLNSARDNELKTSLQTTALLNLVDNEFRSGYIFKGNLSECCGVLTPGIYFYISSAPNYVAKPGHSYQENLVTFECLDQQNGLMRFTSLSHKKSFFIHKDSVNYDVRDTP